MTKKWADILDVGILVLLAINLLVSAYLFNLWVGIMFTGCTVWVGFSEIGSKVRQGLTITQETKQAEWNWKKFYLIFSMNAFWFYLNLHLVMKVWIWK